MQDLRHEGGSQSLEEESDRGGHRRDVSTKTADEGEETSEESNGTKEECDQVESEHKSGQQEVLLGTNELLWNTLFSAKVPWRVKWQRWDWGSAIRIESARWVCAANGEESPSRWVARVRDTVGRGLEEVEFVQRRAVDTTSQDGEQLE